jgi:hypothetical protein
MLDTYRKLQAHGVIGPMMKVGPDGKTPVYDPSGEAPGQLVQRPFAEYPKAVRRVKVDAEGNEQIITLVAGSKSEELKIMSDTMDLEVPRSPLERERDQLAEDLSVQQKMNGQLAQQLEQTLAKLNALSTTVDKLASAQNAKSAPPSGLEAFRPGGAEALALANKK